jgi:hypothetical protein
MPVDSLFGLVADVEGVFGAAGGGDFGASASLSDEEEEDDEESTAPALAITSPAAVCGFPAALAGWAVRAVTFFGNIGGRQINQRLRQKLVSRIVVDRHFGISPRTVIETALEDIFRDKGQCCMHQLFQLNKLVERNRIAGTNICAA